MIVRTSLSMVLAGLLLAATTGCGGDGDAETSTSTPEEPSTTAVDDEAEDDAETSTSTAEEPSTTAVDEADGAVTEDVGASIPDDAEVTVGFLGEDGELADPVQFRPARLAIVFDGLGDLSGSEDIQVSVDAVMDNGEVVGTYDELARYDVADVDADGRLVHVVSSTRFSMAGTFETTASGWLSIDGDRLPFSEVLAVRVDEVEVVNETLELSDGFVEMTVPSSWEIVTDDVVGRVFSSADPPPFDVGDLRETAAVRSGDADVGVFRVIRPLTTTFDEVVAVLERRFSDGAVAERSVGVIDGRETVRIAFDGDSFGTADVLMIGDEILFVQTRWTTDATEAELVRDSIRFDPTVLRAMTHRQTVTFDVPVADASGAALGVVVAELEVPADWGLSEDATNVIGDPVDESRVLVTVTQSAEPLSLDAVLATELARWAGEPTSSAEVELDGIPFTRVDVADPAGPVAVAAGIVTVEGTPAAVTVAVHVASTVGEPSAVLDEILRSAELSYQPSE